MLDESQLGKIPFTVYEYTSYIVDGSGKQTVINSPVSAGQRVDKAFIIYSDRSIYVQKSGREDVYVNGYRLHDGQWCQAMSGSIIWCGNPARVYRMYMYCRRKQMSRNMLEWLLRREYSLTKHIGIGFLESKTAEFCVYHAYVDMCNVHYTVSEIYPERYLTRLADRYVVTVKEELSPEETYDFLYRFTTKYNEYAYALEQLKKLDYISSESDLLGINGTWFQLPLIGTTSWELVKEKSLAYALKERRMSGNKQTDMTKCINLDWEKADSLFRDVAYGLMQFHKRGMVFTGLDSEHIHVNEKMDSAKLVYDMVRDIELRSGTTTEASDVYRLGTIMCKALDHSYIENISNWGVTDQYWKNLSIKCPDYVVETLQKAVMLDVRYRIQNIEEFMHDMRWKMKEPKCKDFKWNEPDLGPQFIVHEDIQKSAFTGYMYGCPLAKTIPGEKYVRTTEVIDYDR